MDFNTAHDIIHEDAKNSSENCPVCNGNLKGDDVQKEAGRIIKQQRQQRSSMHVWGDDLTTEQRNKLNDSDFAYIDSNGGKHLPIHDAAHVRNALARFNQTKFDSDEDKTKAMTKIKSKAKELGVQVSGDKKADDSSYKPSYSPLTLHKASIYPLSEIKASEDGKLPSEIQIMPIGEWDTVPYGKLAITASDLEEMKTNFEKGYRAGVPIDVDHDGKAAAGWIESLRVADDGLWAAVTWTDLGQKLLGEKQYKFFSPEFNPEYTDPENKNTQLSNVLIAGSLVNRPLFKELKPVIASDHLTRGKSGVMLFIESMNIEELLKKKKAGEALTAAEKDFVTKYFAEDAAGDGDADDEEAKKKAAADKEAAEKKKKDDLKGKEQNVSISAAEYNALKANADRGVEAAEKLEAKEIEDTVDSWMFNENGGHFQPAIKDDVTSFYKSLSAEQRKTFSELVDKMPSQKMLFNEVGSAEDLTKGGAADTLTVRAKELMTEAKKDNRKLTFSQAVKQATRENPALAEYDLVAVKGKVMAK